MSDLEVILYHYWDYFFFFFPLGRPDDTMQDSVPLILHEAIISLGSFQPLEGQVIFRDTARSPIQFPSHIGHCVSTPCFYLLCYRYSEKGCPSVLCPWRSRPNVFPVCTLLRLCLFSFLRKNCCLQGGDWLTVCTHADFLGM